MVVPMSKINPVIIASILFMLNSLWKLSSIYGSEKYCILLIS